MTWDGGGVVEFFGSEDFGWWSGERWRCGPKILSFPTTLDPLIMMRILPTVLYNKDKY